MMRIAMFGGTFNPPHLGHMAAARSCVEELSLDLLLLVPDRIPPHKTLPPGSASPAQRLEMCRIAARQIPRCRVSDLELTREGPSYTLDTLLQLRESYPGAQLWLVMGTDMLLHFDRWREPRRIAGLCRLAAVAREPGDRPKLEEKAAFLRESLDAQVDIVDNEPFPASSTQVRAGGADVPLHPAVAEYIRQEGLYLPTLEQLRAAVQARVSPKRYAHTLGCERLAAQMAQKYGVEDYTIRAAAILHDCTKSLSAKEQLILAEKWNIITDYGNEDLPALIHADTGAETARREFRMPDAVVDAIRTHTVGGPGPLTAAQKILYVADLCEETRDYPGVDKLRALALTDLDRAFLAGLRQTAAFVQSQGREPYYVTLDALAAQEQALKKEEIQHGEHPQAADGGDRPHR